MRRFEGASWAVLFAVIALSGCGGDSLVFVDAPPADGAGADAAAVDGAVDATAVDGATDAAATADAATDAPVDAPTDAATDAAVGDDAAIADAASPDASVADAGVLPDDAAVDAAVPQTFYWADWTAATTGLPGTVTGTFAAPSGTVTVSYAGEVRFAQTSGGTNYWVPGTPYINAVTANAPPASDIIALQGSALTNTVTFDPPVTGLVMGLVSLGAPGANVKYAFDTPIVLLSYGAGYYGNGTIVTEGTSTISGTEGHGAIQFVGTVASVSWTIVGGEFWHGFTLGIPAQ